MTARCYLRLTKTKKSFILLILVPKIVSNFWWQTFFGLSQNCSTIHNTDIEGTPKSSSLKANMINYLMDQGEDFPPGASKSKLWAVVQVRLKVCPEYFINIQGQPNALFFMIWLKMTLKCTVHMKTRHFYNHKDPPFDMKHQLMSADPLPVVKLDLSRKANFHYFLFCFHRLQN